MHQSTLGICVASVAGLLQALGVSIFGVIASLEFRFPLDFDGHSYHNQSRRHESRRPFACVATCGRSGSGLGQPHCSHYGAADADST